MDMPLLQSNFGQASEPPQKWSSEYDNGEASFSRYLYKSHFEQR